MWDYIKWQLGIGWVCETIVADTIQTNVYPFYTIVIEKRTYRNIHTNKLIEVSRSYRL